ncbi:YidC/Oxa1 family membrane protein insertase [Amycolatopsis bartoniae]|uniref:Membrane protein insertase YidC n=1 Tax=Amycolatopsis bartoniae TaxID=941986 RepID=A0A8H9ITI0_9PSEU|nr:membrane protein insertase YidC [Amycolatopsis bartoniae]MBB2933221.1 YidC/Oxa1 family membrane protein insertase [Amycolatopsis bartoniae]TVT11790.1 membrane protein insertase YidC [Amycolatopsis bartoniae]GHF57976.1 membrane protein insertase YidC [Amycolatopsis bartoniae]
MLNFIYYPVSFILWCWHKVFGFVLGDNNAIAWILAIMFLTFTVRGIMFKPFVNQVRSMKKMQEFAPELKKIQKKYANDKQRQAAEMQKLQREHGVNPLGSCLPMLLQIPVFIGLNWVLRSFTNKPLDQKANNYFFDHAGVESYVNAKLFGVNIGDAIHHASVLGGTGGGWNWNVAPVAIPLMILASVLTHLTARHSTARQAAAATEANPQAAMMQKLTMYVFPLGVLVFGAFFPIGLLVYWLSNNSWTLMQQRLVYTRIDKEEAAKKAEAKEKRDALAPKPGAKPKPGQKPAQQAKAADEDKPETGGATPASNGGGKRSSKAGSPHRFADQPQRPQNGTAQQRKKPASGGKNSGQKGSGQKRR